MVQWLCYWQALQAPIYCRHSAHGRVGVMSIQRSSSWLDVLSEQPVLGELGDHRTARTPSELGEDPPDVCVDRPQADLQDNRHRLVRVSRRDEPRDLLLAGRE